MFLLYLKYLKGNKIRKLVIMAHSVHKFTVGSFIGHTSGLDCPCNPKRETIRKARSSGRGGSHQGYNTSFSFVHYALPVIEAK